MRLVKLVGLLMILSGCRSAPIALIHRQYEPVKGGRIVVVHEPEYENEVPSYRALEKRIMTDVCGDEGYRIVDEGITSAMDSMTSYSLPYGRAEEVVGYSRRQYKNFLCGATTPKN